jgi:hypothetical protein
MFLDCIAVPNRAELQGPWAGPQLTWHPYDNTFRTSSLSSAEMCFCISAKGAWSFSSQYFLTNSMESPKNIKGKVVPVLN